MANTVSQTTLLGSPASSLGSLTIPANTLKVGDTIELWLYGVCSITASSPTLQVYLLLGGTTIASTRLYCVYGAITNGLVMTSWPPISFVVTAVGSSGAVLAGGALTVWHSSARNALSYLGANGAGGGLPVTVNTTTALAVDLQIVWSAASASDTIQILAGGVRIRG